jgi:FkbM family methyltransferase
MRAAGAVLERAAMARAELGRIVGQPGPLPRSKLAAGYAAIARAWLRGRRGGSEPSWLRIMGLRVAYNNLYALRELYLEIFVDGCYDAPLEAPGTIVDGGANTGMATLYFAIRWPGARILAFEPSSSGYALLVANVRANGVNAGLHQVALGQEDGTAELFLDTTRPAATMNSLWQAQLASGVSETVRVVRLSDYLAGPVDLLKLDVEGSETMVMEELAQAGTLDQVRHVVLEHHARVDRDLAGLARIREILGDARFQVQVSDPRPDPILPDRQLDRLVRASRWVH